MEIRSFPRPPRESEAAKPVQAGGEPRSKSERGERRRRRRDVQERKAKVLMFRTMVLGGTAFFGLIAVVAIGMFREKHDGAAVWKDPNAHEASKLKESGVLVLSEDNAMALVRKVLAARSVTDLGDRVRLKGITEQEAVDFLNRLQDTDGKVRSIAWDHTRNINGIQTEGIRVSFEGNGLARNRLAILTPNEAGVWQFDMASFARKQSLSWDEILKGPEREIELRVHAARDNYYNGAYADEQAWASYALSSEDTDTLLVGYCPRSGDADLALECVLREKRAARVIVRFSRTGAPGSRQGEIKSVLAEDWVRTDVPFDERLAKERSSKGSEGYQPE